MYKTRRQYVKAVGIMGSAGMLGTSGCLGNGGSGDSDDLTEVGIAIAPSGVWVLVLNHLNEEGTIAQHMEEAGYSASITQSWEEVPLFASGQADMVVSMGSMAAARMGAEREVELTANGLLRTQDTGWLVNKGGEYDPANTGSPGASMEKIVEENATVGIGSWSAGYVPVDRLYIEEEFGYAFSEDSDDFSVVTADFAALAQLLDDEEIDVAATAPTLGVPQLMPPDPSMVAVFWTPHNLERLGYNQTNLPLGSCIATKELADNHPDAITAFLSAMKEGHEWVNSTDLEAVFSDEDNIALVGANSKEEAKFMLDWSFNFYDYSGFPTDISFSNSYIESEEQALDSVADLGLVPENWSDYLTFRNVDLDS